MLVGWYLAALANKSWKVTHAPIFHAVLARSAAMTRDLPACKAIFNKPTFLCLLSPSTHHHQSWFAGCCHINTYHDDKQQIETKHKATTSLSFARRHPHQAGSVDLPALKLTLPAPHYRSLELLLLLPTSRDRLFIWPVCSSTFDLSLPYALMVLSFCCILKF